MLEVARSKRASECDALTAVAAAGAALLNVVALANGENTRKAYCSPIEERWSVESAAAA